MPYETEERLKNYLDTHQLNRERICLAVLAIDGRFSEVRPRHPRGGPDGGRDIEAIFKNTQKAIGAVGFINQVNDSSEQKRAIKNKFVEDLTSALRAEIKPSVFVFFTNISLTIGEKDDLITMAREAGLDYCDIFDRERIRITLDSPDGFGIRHQYLNLQMTEAEQASFFAKWGDEIQSVIATGFQKIETTLNRILFLQEAVDVLSGLTLHLELDRTYEAEEIGHFRAFCSMFLREPKLGILEILFGSSDKSSRIASEEFSSASQPAGIKHGISGGQWERSTEPQEQVNQTLETSEGELPEYKKVGSSSSIGMAQVPGIRLHYSHDDPLIRFRPRLNVRDIDEAMFVILLNKSLAEKIKKIHIFSNGYKLQEILRSDFGINLESRHEIPVQFTEEELADPWVIIRPQTASLFKISFSLYTPRKLFTSDQIPDPQRQ